MKLAAAAVKRGAAPVVFIKIYFFKISVAVAVILTIHGRQQGNLVYADVLIFINDAGRRFFCHNDPVNKFAEIQLFAFRFGNA